VKAVRAKMEIRIFRIETLLEVKMALPTP